VIYEANASSSACRLWRLSQVETGAPPSLCDAHIITATAPPVKLCRLRLAIRPKRQKLMKFQAMNDWAPTVLSIALIPLVGYLVFKQWQREAVNAAAREARRREMAVEGQVTDLAPLRERLQTVKANFAAATHDHPVQASAKRSLMVRAREKLRHFGFFQHHPEFAEPGQKAH